MTKIHYNKPTQSNTEDAMTTDRDAMLLANFRAFQKLSAQFKKADKGKYALMRDQKLIGVFATARLAYKHALDTYDDDNYSFQKIGQKPIDIPSFRAISV